MAVLLQVLSDEIVAAGTGTSRVVVEPSTTYLPTYHSRAGEEGAGMGGSSRARKRRKPKGCDEDRDPRMPRFGRAYVRFSFASDAGFYGH